MEFSKPAKQKDLQDYRAGHQAQEARLQEYRNPRSSLKPRLWIVTQGLEPIRIPSFLLWHGVNEAIDLSRFAYYCLAELVALPLTGDLYRLTATLENRCDGSREDSTSKMADGCFARPVSN